MTRARQAVVVGSGPNGLAAAITLAEAGVRVLVLEAEATPGGGLRSFRNEAFGTVHDHCSAVHPLARISPFFRRLGIEREVRFITPPAPFRQGMDPGAGPLRRAAGTFAGIAAHAMLPPGSPVALATGAALGGVGLALGWPIPEGGSQRIADALVRRLESLGGRIECGRRVAPEALPPEILEADLVLWDTDADLALTAAAGRPPRRPRQYGPGAAKADYVTSAPIPWTDPRMARAGTVHLGDGWAEVSRAEKAVNAGRAAKHPVVLVSQPSLFDPTRAPAGLHTVWAYAHVPAGSDADPAAMITAEISRWAPGFEETILDVRTVSARGMAAGNGNYVGGDIASGATRGLQLLTTRHRLPRPGWFLCSGAAFPGPGVHGLSGVIAAKTALRQSPERGTSA